MDKGICQYFLIVHHNALIQVVYTATSKRTMPLFPPPNFTSSTHKDIDPISLRAESPNQTKYVYPLISILTNSLYSSNPPNMAYEHRFSPRAYQPEPLTSYRLPRYQYHQYRYKNPYEDVYRHRNAYQDYRFGMPAPAPTYLRHEEISTLKPQVPPSPKPLILATGVSQNVGWLGQCLKGLLLGWMYVGPWLALLGLLLGWVVWVVRVSYYVYWTECLKEGVHASRSSSGFAEIR